MKNYTIEELQGKKFTISSGGIGGIGKILDDGTVEVLGKSEKVLCLTKIEAVLRAFNEESWILIEPSLIEKDYALHYPSK